MDIVERLRLGDFSPFSGEYIKDADKDEAADEIERLREALREIEFLEMDPRNSGQMWVETLKEVARKTLVGKE